MKNYSLEPANYSDYRDFLRLRFEKLKEKNKKFSLLACAQKSEISKSHLQLLLKKERHISLDKFPPLSKALKLSDEEEYFTYLMICKNASQNPYVKKHFEQILSRIRHQYVISAEPLPLPEKKEYKSLYQDTLAMMLQALIQLKDFKDDPEWIQETLPIEGLSQDEILNALRKLEQLGALVRNEDGSIASEKISLWRPDPYDPSGHSVYTAAAQTVAKLMETPAIYKPSVYMSMSLPMDEEHLLATEKLMIDVHHKICEFSKRSENPTATIYVGNFFLTMARLKK